MTLTRTTPMKRRQSTLTRTVWKRKAPKKRAGHDKGYLAACKGQHCYLMIRDICRNDRSTTVPCHSNQSVHGKGMGLKAKDVYTVPACFACHYQLDQGHILTRDQKRAIWNDAYARWSADRDAKDSK